MDSASSTRTSLSSPGQPVRRSRATWTGSRASRPGPPGGHLPPLQLRQQLRLPPPQPQPQQQPLQQQLQPPNLLHPLLDSLLWSSSKISDGDSSSNLPLNSNLRLSSSNLLLSSNLLHSSSSLLLS